MTLSDLASLATLVSGIAVLVSLFYLGLQIRQNTRHSRALIHQGRAARMSDMALHLTEFRSERAIEQCFQGDPNAEPGALIRFYGYCRAYFVGIEDGFYHHREGLMDEQAFASFETTTRSVFQRTPGIAAAWLIMRDQFEPKFVAYLDRLLASVSIEDNVPARVSRWRTAVASLRRKPEGAKTSGDAP